MGFIAEGNAQLFQETLRYLQSLDLTYYPQIEIGIQDLAKTAQESYKTEAFAFLQKSTEHAGNPKLHKST